MNKSFKKSLEFKFDTLSEDGIITGYAAVIGNIDSYGDIIEAGAFTECLKTKDFSDIPLLWQHDSRLPIGSILELREDNKGLKFKGQILLTVSKGREARELAKARIIKGVSFGYIAKKWHYNEENNRIITEVDIWEISLVTFPANSEAGIDSVKSTSSKRLIEEMLTRDAGLSRKQARLLLSGGFKAAFPMQDAREGDETDDNTRDAVDLAQIITEIKNATLNIRG